jgi:ATP-dependent exoDNAse (exonuclease V) alpha subunit
MSLDLNERFLEAFTLMNTSDRHLFITGKAGTGKSTLLDYFRSHTKKNVAVLAPTGVAAVNVKGQTIHSFFGFKPSITPQTVQKASSQTQNLIKQLDTIIIDEISMVRADLLDCVDASLRLNGRDKYAPFGGIQVIMIGDLFQLPPVVTPDDKFYLADRYTSPYFFDANVFSCITLTIVELDTIYRQRDDIFIDVLNAIRTNAASDDHLTRLNGQLGVLEEIEHAITLTTTNALADEVNTRKLDTLTGKEYVFEGESSGAFIDRDSPAPKELHLKVGAHVMLLNNDTSKRWVNGSIGVVTAVKEGDIGELPTIMIKLDDDRKVEVAPYTWESTEFVLEDDQTVTSRANGSFTQFPMKLAWAVTIHKSQGKTFDHVILDIGRGTFAHGQLYVALSRCTSLGGIRLKQQIQRRHILMDPRVLAFTQQFAHKKTYRGAEARDEAQRMF